MDQNKASDNYQGFGTTKDKDSQEDKIWICLCPNRAKKDEL
jgi:hypothetical protein